MLKYGINCKTQKLSFKKKASPSISYTKNRELPAYTFVNGSDQKYNIMLTCNRSKENNFKNQLRKYNLLVSVEIIMYFPFPFDLQTHAQLMPIESLSHTVGNHLGQE